MEKVYGGVYVWHMEGGLNGLNTLLFLKYIHRISGCESDSEHGTRQMAEQGTS